MLTEQDKKDIKQQIKSNQHEVFVVSIEEMDAIVKSSPRGNMAQVNNSWQKLKNKAEIGASYYASADDLRTLSKLVGDLGGFATKAYVKTYGGKPHIILKGYPGLRKVLTGTKYGIKNPKVITMGLGKSGAIHAAKSGGILSVVLLSAYRVADYFLSDRSTMTQLLGSLATDIVKVGIATGASIVAASVVSAAFSVAIGPIAAVVIVGVFTSMALGALDEHYGITEKVIAGLDEIANDINTYIERKKRNIQNNIADVVADVIDTGTETAKNAVVNTAKRTLERFLSPVPGVFR